MAYLEKGMTGFHEYTPQRPHAEIRVGLIQKNEWGRWLKWRPKGVQQNFGLINYSLGHVNCFASIQILLKLSVFYHHHEENEASCLAFLF